MRTSLIELKEIDAHLLKTSAPEEECLFQAKLILDPDLPENVRLQHETHRLIHQYSRKKLKENIALVQARFFNDPAQYHFINKIRSLFKS